MATKKGAKGSSMQSYAVKSKGIPGVTTDKSGSNGMRQSTSDIHAKFNTKRRHA